MFSPSQIGIKYLRYVLQASNGKGHGMHSPFIFDFITHVLNDKKEYPAYQQVEKLRSSLLKDRTLLTIEDYGAGSVKSPTNQRTVGAIARHAAKPKKFGQLLYRMASYYQPGNIVELGTSLGLTTAYLSLAHSSGKLITLEGAKAIASLARQNFNSLNLQNISVVQGNFDGTLVSVIDSVSVVDLAFIDGNHRKEPTLRYFQQLMTKSNNDSIFIFDDIHWSREMEEAWSCIQKDPRVRCTIDLFFIGIVFFRQEFREKQDFSIRF